jgi:HEAT repeat protein
MKTKQIAGLVTGLAVIALVAGWLEPTHSIRGKLRGEPFVHDRPASFWAEQLAADPGQRAKAVERLVQDGRRSVAVLEHLLRTSASAEIRWTSAELLGQIGSDARPAANQLLASLKDADSHVRVVSAATLPKVEAPASEAVPALLDLLKREPRPEVSRALSVYRKAAKSAVPELMIILSNQKLDSESRWNAARTLGKIGSEAVEAIPLLVDCLRDEATTVREHSAEALGDMGPAAGGAAGDLAKVLNDTNTRVRRDAVRSLGQIGPSANSVADDVEKLLADPDQSVREAALVTLKVIAPERIPAPKGPEKSDPKAPFALPKGP